PDLELPPDPFPDWHQFLGWHEIPAAEMDDPGWEASFDDPLPECFQLQCA
ncbi:hypothetical protein SAMN04487916_1161, partial [Arthrobacter sp. ov407]